jgi:hypothetical protein
LRSSRLFAFFAFGFRPLLWRKRKRIPPVPDYGFAYHILIPGHSYAMHAPRRRRARFAGEIEKAERAMDPLREKLATIDAANRIFEPECNPQMIPSIRPLLRGLFFGYRELSRLTLDALREAGKPVALAGVVEYIILTKGLDVNARPRRPSRTAPGPISCGRSGEV